MDDHIWMKLVPKFSMIKSPTELKFFLKLRMIVL